MNSIFQIRLNVVCFILTAAGIILSGSFFCNAAGNVNVVFSNNRLSLSAENEPLVPLLEKIAKKTNVVIFISKGFDPGKVSVHVDKLPLEKAFNRILKGFNVAMVYNRKQGVTSITAVKIYPEGRISGPMNVVIKSSVPEIIPPAVKSVSKYAGHNTDILGPEEYVNNVRYDSLVSTALKFEKEENKAWEKIQNLKKQINSEPDETKNNVLSIALLDKYGMFETMQENHVNILENMHRVEHFNESKAARDKQQEK